jgi:transposase InsO family protein
MKKSKFTDSQIMEALKHTALTHLAATFEQYNKCHPHKAVKYRSPREFRRAAASST